MSDRGGVLRRGERQGKMRKNRDRAYLIKRKGERGHGQVPVSTETKRGSKGWDIEAALLLVGPTAQSWILGLLNAGNLGKTKGHRDDGRGRRKTHRRREVFGNVVTQNIHEEKTQADGHQIKRKE